MPDEDGDTIADEQEGRATEVDTDLDGTPDWLDADSDGDGIGDDVEAGDADTTTVPVDSDGDGTPDFRDLDSDANGLGDATDGVADFDGDGKLDFADLDDDGDRLNDVLELGDDPLAPRDTDGDGSPDFHDTDADGDSVADRDEQMPDPDMDGLPAYRDQDADGDCRSDASEAGDGDLATPPVDSDGDGSFDLLDLDADGDGLLDSVEDANCNGLRDGTESSASAADTDGDGVTDLVEVAAGTDWNDPASNPQANGDFVFLVPYIMPPDPLRDTLDFSTNITQADVFFLMDTTGSMLGEISNLRTSLMGIIDSLSAEIPNIGFGVGGYDDFPMYPYGSGPSGDQPFYLTHRIQTVTTSAGKSLVQSSVNSLTTHNGSDGPESGWEGLHQLATGAGTSAGAASVPAFNPATAWPSSPPAGESIGTLGGAGFRAGSLPVIITITDAHSHNSEGFPLDMYFFAGGARRSTAVPELMSMGARVISVISNDWDYASAKADASFAVTQTGALVPPSAWGTPGIDRPAACAAGQCCTGMNDAGEAPDASGLCPLTFTIDPTGAGLGAAITRAVKVLTTFGVIDIGARVDDDASDAVDAVASFVDRIAANPSGAAPCATGLAVVDSNGDGTPDRFPDVNPGTTVCFDVIPKMNTTVMPTGEPQMFKATLVVLGDDVTTLDTRDVWFLVPPGNPDEPID